MKDIDGIDQVLRVLTPHWGDMEADFTKHNQRFLDLAASEHDSIGRVLRVHLVVESFVDSFLSSHFGIQDLPDLRLSFAQKTKLLPHASSSASFVRPGILQLNSVRNKFGHRLNHIIEPHEISAIYEVLHVARRGIKFTSSIHALEAFGPVACAFLSVPPKHLQDLFVQAFKNVQSNDPFLAN